LATRKPAKNNTTRTCSHFEKKIANRQNVAKKKEKKKKKKTQKKKTKTKKNGFF